MQGMMTSLHNLLQTWIPVIWILAAMVLAGCGIGCMIPNEKIKTFCRGHFFSVLIGFAITVSSTAIAKEVAAAFAF